MPGSDKKVKIAIKARLTSRQNMSFMSYGHESQSINNIVATAPK